ncbi:MAG: type VI secretion system tube protein Hcp, partial [Telluria sp.]|nr:type VI secretion system tube protein Hcp [Telluria sp.]
MADQRQPPAPSAFLLPVNPAPVQASNNANSAQPERGFKMAIDAYLQIEGIKGESADSAHPGWIEATGISWGVHQPKSATASTGG